MSTNTYNKVTIRGYLGNNPDLKYYDEKVCVAKFSVATHTDGYITSDGRLVVGEVTEWHNVVCFYGLAKKAEQLFRKGLMVEIEGRITYVVYYSSDGTKKKSAYILAQKMELLTQEIISSPIAPSQKENVSSPYGQYLETLSEDAEDTLPF